MDVRATQIALPYIERTANKRREIVNLCKTMWSIHAVGFGVRFTRWMQFRLLLLAVLALVATSCTSSDTAEVGTATFDLADLPTGEVIDFGPAPEIPEGEYTPELAAAIDTLFGRGTLADIFTEEQNDALVFLGDSGDVRVTWILMDMLRFADTAARADRVTTAANKLTGLDTGFSSAWNETTNSLIGWDIPAPPDYVDAKRAIYSSILPQWGDLFESSESVDWRYVSWGGVLIDDRPFDTTDLPCNCIPAADNPTTQPAAEAAWLEDDDVVFGVVINGEARAYPRQIMEVREMVNDTLGGRDFAMPYCTLCGSAQVWFTDSVPEGVERPVLRTSGLLSRSNKVMYDLVSQSIFDTFLGTADTGVLHDQGVALVGHTVVTSTWGAWVEQHPDTTVLIEDLALGRDFDFRNGRDSSGPIFPIGDVDVRLAVQEDVLGVIQENGTPLAIHVDSATAALGRGEVVEIDGIRVIRSGDGVQAIDSDGNDIVAHQAFWFAWSQFYPSTEVWPNV